MSVSRLLLWLQIGGEDFVSIADFVPLPLLGRAPGHLDLRISGDSCCLRALSWSKALLGAPVTTTVLLLILHVKACTLPYIYCTTCFRVISSLHHPVSLAAGCLWMEMKLRSIPKSRNKRELVWALIDLNEQSDNLALMKFNPAPALYEYAS